MTIFWSTNSIVRENNQKMVIDYLKDRKKDNPEFKVIDLGGAANPWADEVVDAYVDIFDVPNKNIIRGNLLDEATWDKIQKEKFDFCICTHVLEDIRSPDFVIEKINQNFKSGYISMPCKHTELSWVDTKDFIGYHHHRWIFTIRNGKLMAAAKFPGLQLLNKIRKIGKFTKLKNKFLNRPISKRFIDIDWIDTKINKKNNDLAFMFSDGFDFEYINNDYAGKNMDALLDIYKIDLADGL